MRQWERTGLLKKRKPIASEIRFHSIDNERVIAKLKTLCLPGKPGHGDVMGIMLKVDDKTIPGFAEFYDGHGEMIKTINLERDNI